MHRTNPHKPCDPTDRMPNDLPEKSEVATQILNITITLKLRGHICQALNNLGEFGVEHPSNILIRVGLGVEERIENCVNEGLVNFG